MKYSEEKHSRAIRDQFTRQAVPFTQLPGHLSAVDLLLEMSGVCSEDQVLDVACGPGIVACEFAKVARHVSGIDLTDKMIEEARKRQQTQSIKQMSWRVGSADCLPYEDANFSIVLSRYAFHHLIEPEAVLREMCRVCRSGGRVLIADPVLPAAQVNAFNRMERLRDPSHTQAFSSMAFEAMLHASGLVGIRRAVYGVDMELEAQLAASFPEPGDEETIRRIFERDVDAQAMGLNTRRVGAEIHFTYPISIYLAYKDSESA